MRLRKLWTAAATVVIGVGASAGLLWAGPKVGSIVTVRVMSAKVMKSPKFIGPTAGGVSRGDALTVREIKGDWYRVDGPAKGWINRTSVAEGKLALSSKPGGGGGASRDEVELAGRGFTPDVERQYRGAHPDLDFGHVDAIERTEVDLSALESFVTEGGLGGGQVTGVGRTLALTAALALALGGGLSCKVQLTPEGLAQTVSAMVDAQKDLTPENEYWTGRSVATNLLAKFKYHYRDAEALRAGRLEGLTAYVSQVGGVLAAAALETRRAGDRPAPISGWHFIVVESDTINAFAAPGGWVLVTSGAVAAATSEDELAAVLAHEIAHVVRGHALGSIKKGRWAGVAKTALDTSVQLDAAQLGELTKVFEGAMDDIVDNLLVKGYSRDTEFEADKVGLAILAHAGYDPQAAVRLLQTLDKKQPTKSSGFSATHPSARDRITKVSAQAGKLGTRAIPPIRVTRFQAAAN